MVSLNENIRTLRKKLQLTQDEFAQKLGIKRSLVGAYEEGRAEPRAELLQKNIETARKNQLDEERHRLERDKIGLEHRKLTHGVIADEQTARDTLAEQRQANIEKARSNELAGQQFEFGKGKAQRDEERSKREHELAMNPPPAPAPASAKTQGEASPSGGGPQDAQGHGHAIEEIKHVVSDLSEKVHGGHIPDHVPLLLEIRDKLNRPRPTAVKRTKDGFRLVFDEGAPPEPKSGP